MRWKRKTVEKDSHNLREVVRRDGTPYMWAEVRDGRVNLKFENMPKYTVSFAAQAIPQLVEILNEGYNSWFSGNN